MRAALFVALLCLCCMSPPAAAKDMNGKLGVGLEQSLGGVTGIALRYWPGAAFGIVGVVGVDIISVKEEDRRGLATTFTEPALLTTSGCERRICRRFRRVLPPLRGSGRSARVLEARLGRLRSAHAEITYISLLSLEGLVRSAG
jgi:hypothetical protein